MIHIKFIKVPIVIIFLSLTGCSLFTSCVESSSSVVTKEFTEALTIDTNYAYLFTKGDCYKKITLTLNVTTPKSIYFIFSNSSGSSIVSSESYSLSSSNLTFSSSISSSILSSKLNENNFVEPDLPEPPKLIENSKNNLLKSSVQSSVSSGDTYNFYEASGGKTVSATCRKVVSNISTNQGSKTLNIWVADNCWINGGSKSNLITQIMVDAMADNFLKTGLNNDIYDWVTNVCGAEWGVHNKSNLISSDQSIDILLCDISDDNKTIGSLVLGYFWNGNNFLKTSNSSSNEKIMFCIDAVYYGNRTGSTWEVEDTCSKISISTLAHEFQHMINYYQINVVKGVTQDTWLNELLSMSMEDLLANKMFTDYSSSPYYFRFSSFNYYNYYPLCSWSNASPYYSINYAFGSYLLRQFGGANFVKNIYSSGKISSDAIESATGKSFSTIQRNWGAAYLLSDKNLSSGDFAYNTNLSSSLNGITYNLVEVNAYNSSFSNSPKIYSLNDKQNINTRANVYYKVADNLSVGIYTINIVMNSTDLELTVVAK